MAITEHNDAQIYHSPCGERRLLPRLRRRLQGISIHAPRVGSDNGGGNRYLHTKISIHAPRVGSDFAIKSCTPCIERFQSTLPVWGATLLVLVTDILVIFQSTLPVWGATTWTGLPTDTSPVISIHAPRVGSDGGRAWSAYTGRRYFNPRSPCGERRDAESLSGSSRINFNPRSPCGERRLPWVTSVQKYHFNPRSPCGERPPQRSPY